MTRHTPGPWKLTTCLRDAPRLTMVQPGPDRDEVIECRGRDAEANARLVAAAPRMLEILTVVSHMECPTSPCGVCFGCEARTLLREIDGA